MIKQLPISKAGFTLIELLVVISIIGILAAMAAASFTGTQKQARDTQRKSDLTQYRTLLESYANKSGSLYPVYVSATTASGNLCTSLNTVLNSGNCPEDPKYSSDPTYLQYQYESDTAGTKYVLWNKLENSTNYWVNCSNGKSGTIATSSWSNPVSGTCPL